MKNNRCNHPQINSVESNPRAQKELLTQEEEKELSIRIQNGHKAQEMLKNGTLQTPEERAEAQRIADDGLEARNILVVRNMGLAHSFANQLFRRSNEWVQDQCDYSQDALECLIHAADTFLWQKGFRFGTYASMCIQNGRHRINALLGAAMRQPEGQMKGIAQYKRLLHQGYSVDEIAAKMNISLKTVFLYEMFLDGGSLQDPVGTDEEACERGELIADTNAEGIAAEIELRDLWKQVEAVLLQLPDEQQRLLTLRFGLWGEAEHKYKDMVGICGKSPSSIQKKTEAALEALRKVLWKDWEDPDAHLPLAA